MIRVAIADDHAELRLALRLFLGRSKDIEVVCEASNGREAVECVRRYRPDVLVMDVEMPELNGFAAAEGIGGMAAGTRIILISIHEGSAFVEKARAVGARGYITKGKLVASLTAAVETVYRGGVWGLGSGGREEG